MHATLCNQSTPVGGGGGITGRAWKKKYYPRNCVFWRGYGVGSFQPFYLSFHSVGIYASLPGARAWGCNEPTPPDVLNVSLLDMIIQRQPGQFRMIRYSGSSAPGLLFSPGLGWVPFPPTPAQGRPVSLLDKLFIGRPGSVRQYAIPAAVARPAFTRLPPPSTRPPAVGARRLYLTHCQSFRHIVT